MLALALLAPGAAVAQEQCLFQSVKASPSDRARAAGYPGGAGENIAANSTGSALSLFEQWRGSSGHNQNMLGGSYRAAGFGIADRFPGLSGGVTGTQMFGLAGANSNDTALDLYASSPGCAKAKLRKLKAKGKKKRRAARRKVKRLCAAPLA